MNVAEWGLDDLREAMDSDSPSWEAVLDEAAAAWLDEVQEQWKSLMSLRRAAGLVSAHDRLRVSLEGPNVPAIMGEIRRLERYIWHLLENPEAPAWEDKHGEGYVPTCLEWAEVALDEAWRVLKAAARHTRSLRARMALALAISRIGVLRARIAQRSPAQSHTPSGRSRIGPVAEVFRSLTQAAHAPPRVGAHPRPVIAGGGHL